MDRVREQRRGERFVIDPADLRLILDQGKDAPPTFLEALLDANYKVGLTSFKFEKNGLIVASTWHKVANVLWWIVLPIFWMLHKWNHIYYPHQLHVMPKLFTLVTTAIKIQYWYQWTDKQQYTELLKRLKSDRFSNFFHSQNSNLFRLIRWTSLLLTILICGFGLNIIPTRVFHKDGWSWETVFLAHDHSLKHLFSGWLIKSEDQCEKWPGTWSETTVPFGLLGVLLEFCVLLCDTFMLDTMLCSSLELLNTVQEFPIDVELPYIILMPHEIRSIRTGLADMLTRAHQVSSLSDLIDDTLNWSQMARTMFWCVCPSYGTILLMQQDWAPAVIYGIYTSKLWLQYFIQNKVSRKCSWFTRWVIHRIAEEHQSLNSRQRKTIPPGS